MAYRRTPSVDARRAATRDRVLGVTRELLAEAGYAGCSIAAVAKRAGVAAGSVYLHFPTKADLLAEAFRLVVRHEVEAVAQAVLAAPDHRAGVVAVVETFAGRALKAPRLAYALLAEPIDAAVERERLRFRIAFRDIVAEVLGRAVRDGDLPPQNPAVTAAALVGAVGEVLVGPLAAGHADPDTIPNLISFCLRAIGVDDAVHP
ncbi:TetR/AcrR family transcriptional regulator [Crossiella sp. CA198]|uniref:TetR/AcrR family transcriptional regulator n=1 Tax=Crossiella sp. CA198 TaxID=3455607 RepID=UPI003F8D29C2